jgi:hypothetical protein
LYCVPGIAFQRQGADFSKLGKRQIEDMFADDVRVWTFGGWPNSYTAAWDARDCETAAKRVRTIDAVLRGGD